LKLVHEALHERAVILRNAPHLVHAQPFLLPAYARYELQVAEFADLIRSRYSR
jgi:glycerol-3-phosphate dehydrogenase